MKMLNKEIHQAEDLYQRVLVHYSMHGVPLTKMHLIAWARETWMLGLHAACEIEEIMFRRHKSSLDSMLYDF